MSTIAGTLKDREGNDFLPQTDVSLVTGLEDYVQKSQTAGLLKNDGTVDTSQYLTQHQDISGKADKSELATVATSGSYNDLSDKPSIPTKASDVHALPDTTVIPPEQVNSDWNANSGKAQILNKPTIPAAQIQSDWNQTNTEAKDYIKNKPNIGEQVNADWDATSGPAEILHKPTIPDVSAKADKVPNPTNGNFAGLDANGNLTDSGKKASDFQAALSAQTAYTEKGSATKVPQITTNNLGQVTSITEVTITQPDVSNLIAKSQTSGLVKNDGTIDESAYATQTWVGQQGYLTQHQDISGKEDNTNKKAAITGNESSTAYYPTTKAVADYVGSVVGSINTILDTINGEVL